MSQGSVELDNSRLLIRSRETQSPIVPTATLVGLERGVPMALLAALQPLVAFLALSQHSPLASMPQHL